MPEVPPSQKPQNGALSLLSTLASSSSQWVQLGTLGFVALSGVGNWLATWRASDNNRSEIVQGQERIRDEVIRQVKDIHQWIADSQDEFHKGNIDSSINRKILSGFKEELADFERRQLVLLGNQAAMLENQNKILAEQHQLMEQMNGREHPHPGGSSLHGGQAHDKSEP